MSACKWSLIVSNVKTLKLCQLCKGRISVSLYSTFKVYQLYIQPIGLVSISISFQDGTIFHFTELYDAFAAKKLSQTCNLVI